MDELLQPGAVVIEELKLINQYEKEADIVNFYREFNIFEDMQSPCIYAEILMLDNINLISRFPIVGNEMVVVKLRTPTFDDTPEKVIEKIFHVYGIKNRTVNGDKQAAYTLELISAEGYLDLQTTLTQSFSGSTDELVIKIFEDHLTYNENSSIYVNGTPHKTNIKYTSNYWSPFKNLSYISRRAQADTGQATDFLFYESKNGFMFCSPERLISTQKKAGIFDEYVYELVPDTFKRGTSGLNHYGSRLSNEMTRTISVTAPKIIDSISGIQNGYFASAIRSYDLTTKKLTETVFDMSEQAANFEKTADGVPVPKKLSGNPYNHTKFIPVNSSLYNDYGITNNPEINNAFPADYIINKTHFRNSYLNSLLHTRFEIVIHGRTDIAVGQCINFLYPSTGTKGDTDTADESVDKFLSGIFLITAIRHQIQDNKHVIKAEIVKNGFNLSVN